MIIISPNPTCRNTRRDVGQRGQKTELRFGALDSLVTISCLFSSRFRSFCLSTTSNNHKCQNRWVYLCVCLCLQPCGRVERIATENLHFTFYTHWCKCQTIGGKNNLYNGFIVKSFCIEILILSFNGAEMCNTAREQPFSLPVQHIKRDLMKKKLSRDFQQPAHSPLMKESNDCSH